MAKKVKSLNDFKKEGYTLFDETKTWIILQKITKYAKYRVSWDKVHSRPILRVRIRGEITTVLKTM